MLSFKPFLGCEARDPFGAEAPAAWALRPKALLPGPAVLSWKLLSDGSRGRPAGQG